MELEISEKPWSQKYQRSHEARSDIREAMELEISEKPWNQKYRSSMASSDISSLMASEISSFSQKYRRSHGARNREAMASPISHGARNIGEAMELEISEKPWSQKYLEAMEKPWSQKYRRSHGARNRSRRSHGARNIIRYFQRSHGARNIGEAMELEISELHGFI